MSCRGSSRCPRGSRHPSDCNIARRAPIPSSRCPSTRAGSAKWRTGLCPCRARRPTRTIRQTPPSWCVPVPPSGSHTWAKAAQFPCRGPCSQRRSWCSGRMKYRCFACYSSSTSQRRSRCCCRGSRRCHSHRTNQRCTGLPTCSSSGAHSPPSRRSTRSCRWCCRRCPDSSRCRGCSCRPHRCNRGLCRRRTRMRWLTLPVVLQHWAPT